MIQFQRKLNPLVPTPQHLSTGPNKVAIVLNGRAKSVSEALIRDLSQVMRDETLFFSRSLEQSRFIAKSIVNQGFDVVLCGGGDGTFSQVVTDIMGCHPAKPPAFGTLRLGTGNALATTLKAAPGNRQGLAEDLLLARMCKVQARLPLLRVEGKLSPFAGLGLDALILEDYNNTRRALEQTPLELLGKGSMGYAMAIASRSLWKLMLKPLPEVTIRNEGAPTCRIDLKEGPSGPGFPGVAFFTAARSPSPQLLLYLFMGLVCGCSLRPCSAMIGSSCGWAMFPP